MPFHSIEPRRLYRQIADQIRGLIKSGEFPAGARLPPERDLAKQLGVSRPSVREALIALEVEGLVEVRIGSGIYVLASPSSAGESASESDAPAGPFELLRARYVIEAECAALREINARYVQGYLFARPMGPDAIPSYLAAEHNAQPEPLRRAV